MGFENNCHIFSHIFMNIYNLLTLNFDKNRVQIYILISNFCNINNHRFPIVVIR